MITLLIITIITLAAALAAAALPNLMHAALSLVLAFLGVAAFYFFLGAEFVGLVQVLVYVGAVAVLIVFTILLTRREESKRWDTRWSGFFVALSVFGGLIWAVLKTPMSGSPTPDPTSLTVRRIGQILMTDYVWPLQAVGVLLTVALVGALVLVMEEKQ
jgi:NADH:ubiquinone oxidoreductase subunit 6 (subunit J)